MSASICNLSGLRTELLVFVSIRIIPAERLCVLTEVVVLFLCIYPSNVPALFVVFTSSVAGLWRSNGSHTSIYESDC